MECTLLHACYLKKEIVEPERTACKSKCWLNVRSQNCKAAQSFEHS